MSVLSLKISPILYQKKKIIKQQLNHIKNYSVVGGPRDLSFLRMETF